MKNAMRKDFFREIRKSLSRYLSLIFIVALGVAFFAGVRSAETDMQLSADVLYDETNFMDIRVLGTMGITEEDLETVREIKGVRDVEAVNTLEVLTSGEGQEYVLQATTLTTQINRPILTEGRLPEYPWECLMDETLSSVYQVGDTVTLCGDKDTDLTESLSETSFRITGFANNSAYLTDARGTATIGNGTCNGLIYLLPEIFTADYYTCLYLTVEDALELTAFTDEYEEQVEEIVTILEALADSRCQIRHDSILEEAEEELGDARKELADAEEEVEQELADALQELTEGEQELQDAQDELKSAKNELYHAENEIESGWQQWNEGKTTLENTQNELNTGWTQWEEGKNTLDSNQKELDSGWKQWEEGKLSLEEARAQLEDGWKQYKAGKKELEDQKATVADGWKQYEAGLKELESGEQQLQAGWIPYNLGLQAWEAEKALLDSSRKSYEAIASTLPESQRVIIEQGFEQSQARLDSRKAELDATYQQLTDAQAQLEAGKATLEATEKQLTEAEELLAAGEATLAETYQQLTEAEKQLNSGYEELKSNEQQLQEAQNQLNAGYKELESSEKQLQEAQKELESGVDELNSTYQTLNQAEQELSAGKKEINNAKNQLAEAETELADGWKEYEDGKKEAEEELFDARKELAEAEAELKDLDVPEWYVLDRNSIQSYVEYGMDSGRIGSIGKVFPAIFFLVAALVALTSMTRMVEEERTLIGTYKALGYSQAAIASKYLLYALSASLLGSLLGVLVGSTLFPLVIMLAYCMLYVNVTTLCTPIQLDYALMSTGLAVLCTTVATWSSCAKVLRATPAELMRPAAPKQGKRILLERIPILWRHMSFTSKSTLRNLIRYKKRFFMTIFGIGGCMALLMVGFGLRDSIAKIVDNQYATIFHYEASVSLDIDPSTLPKVEAALDEFPEIQDFLTTYTVNRELKSGSVEKEAYVFVPKNPELVDGFIHFRSRTNPDQTYTLDDEGVILTEKIAKMLGVGVGDSFRIAENDTESYEVQVSAITENYLQHYVYMTPTLYTKVYGHAPEYNQVLLHTGELDPDTENQLASELLEFESFSSISYVKDLQEDVDTMMRSLDLVIWVLIVAAGLLAFVVLFNLNSINITERRRELATLKVLGFYDGEVAGYVYRENILLTFFGIFAGIFMGLGLHQFVIQTLEVDMLMFGQKIFPPSYLYCSVITFLFSMLVNGIMYFSLKKIDMIESLKSVE